MRMLRDHKGQAIRLTAERLSHIFDHPEMVGLEIAIMKAVRRSHCVVGSASDSTVRLYYRLVQGTLVGDKYVCVFVKLSGGDAFVLTAHLTDKVKKGVRKWPNAE